MANACFAGCRVTPYAYPVVATREERNVVLMRFAEDWFIKNPSKTGRKTHRHFWLGEGGSNCFFEQVTHLDGVAGWAASLVQAEAVRPSRFQQHPESKSPEKSWLLEG